MFDKSKYGYNDEQKNNIVNKGKNQNTGKPVQRDESKIFNFEKEGYRDENGIIREDLITKEAELVAKWFGEDKLTNSQLRAFFNEVKALKNKVDGKEEEFLKVYPSILLLKSKVQYRANKDGQKMKTLRDFILKNVDQIMKENKNGLKAGFDAFINFTIFFETIVGYSQLSGK
ncbi:type III-A CRISPR-associated protein Csm2 [Fusobacterium sp. PH5-44]|uniref:type III-A CRISPR-associated protein Csm2 n=1 Tax=unclassified Fusobacterium TaxID=2648384 RepID=UPI003D1E9520